MLAKQALLLPAFLQLLLGLVLGSLCTPGLEQGPALDEMRHREDEREPYGRCGNKRAGPSCSVPQSIIRRAAVVERFLATAESQWRQPGSVWVFQGPGISPQRHAGAAPPPPHCSPRRAAARAPKGARLKRGRATLAVAARGGREGGAGSTAGAGSEAARGDRTDSVSPFPFLRERRGGAEGAVHSFV